MDFKIKKSKKGFTLIELMVVILIIGILVTIALPNMISAQDRAKIAAVKSNMHTYQVMFETYSVDWSGRYPVNTKLLYKEAINKKYDKYTTNPFNTLRASLTTQKERSSIVGSINSDGTYTRGGVILPDITLSMPINSSLDGGTVIYVPFDPSISSDTDINDTSLSVVTGYNLYGVAKDVAGARLLSFKGNVLTLTNG